MSKNYYKSLDLWKPFSSWIEKLWNIEIDQIEDFKNQMLLAIEKAKQFLFNSYHGKPRSWS